MPQPVRTNLSSFARQQETAVTPNSRFAFRLFHELAGDGSENIFFSPASVMLCLSLVHELASGETKQAMASALGLAALDREGINLEMVRLKSAFGDRDGATVSFGNAVWLKHRASVAQELRSQLRSLYDAELASVDFSSPATVGMINSWVKDKTHGKIGRIVDHLSPLTALMAVNAVYFKGGWLSPFRTEWTREETFHLASGNTKPWPLMKKSADLRYFEDEQVQVVAMSYFGRISMYVALPAKQSDLVQFRQSLTADLWARWMSAMEEVRVDLKFPRFHVDYSAALNPALTALGMERAFDPKRAEFEHVNIDPPSVWIDKVLHRAVAEVNEKGTEAAAFTATAGLWLGVPRKPERRVAMIVDRPFLFAIRDEHTKAIMFLGWVDDPQ